MYVVFVDGEPSVFTDYRLAMQYFYQEAERPDVYDVQMRLGDL